MLVKKHKLSNRISTPKANDEKQEEEAAKPIHDKRGKFLPGNQAAKGKTNPFAAKVMDFRKALFDAVTPEDFTAVAKKLLMMAKQGKIKAIQILFDRLIGRVPIDLEAMLLERAGIEKDERFL